MLFPKQFMGFQRVMNNTTVAQVSSKGIVYQRENVRDLDSLEPLFRMSLTLFEKIINKEIPAEIIYEDDVSIVIEDINPQAPTHLLIIPKKVIPKLSDASNEDQEILGHLMLVAGKIADQLGLDETFRLVVNNGAKAGQSVFHLHLHLISGRPLNWPPG